jgi:RimJ/RimL family protein N-acetyltransferase
MSTAPGAIFLRPACSDDAALLLEWANDPATRAASFDRVPIAWDEHVAWLGAVLADPERRLWIAEEEGVAVGQVRVDRARDGVGVVSIGLAPGARGRGLGRTVLGLGVAAAIRELGIRRARAVVMAANLPSRRLFQGAGFVVVDAAAAGVTLGAGLSGHPAALVLEADLTSGRPPEAGGGPGR